MAVRLFPLALLLISSQALVVIDEQSATPKFSNTSFNFSGKASERDSDGDGFIDSIQRINTVALQPSLDNHSSIIDQVQLHLKQKTLLTEHSLFDDFVKKDLKTNKTLASGSAVTDSELNAVNGINNADQVDDAATSAERVQEKIDISKNEEENSLNIPNDLEQHKQHSHENVVVMEHRILFTSNSLEDNKNDDEKGEETAKSSDEKMELIKDDENVISNSNTEKEPQAHKPMDVNSLESKQEEFVPIAQNAIDSREYSILEERVDEDVLDVVMVDEDVAQKSSDERTLLRDILGTIFIVVFVMIFVWSTRRMVLKSVISCSSTVGRRGKKRGY